MNEVEKRRSPGFEPGVPVVLADGQAWQFPRPMVRWRKVYREDVPVLEGRSSFGPEFDAAKERYVAGTTLREVGLASIDLAEVMLLRNYDLSRDELADLLPYTDEDGELGETWKSIYQVAYGIAPKPSPGGEG